jgi:hypothetical protein
VVEVYRTRAEEGEPLLRYQVPVSDSSIYLRDIGELRSQREFVERFDDEERFFAIVPRRRLAAINMSIRQKFERNLPVLDARSSRILLVSNALEEGEENANFIAEALLEGPEEVAHEVTFADPSRGGERVHATFDGKLEFLGYQFGGEPERDRSGRPIVKVGDSPDIGLCFRVLERVRRNYKLFVHIDTRGNRIGADHYPLEGDFPTNYWLPGDIVCDRHSYHVPPFTQPGVYRFYYGFYIGSTRMEVSPRAAHDGGNRVVAFDFVVRP